MALVLSLVGTVLFATICSAKIEGPVTVSRTAGRNITESFSFTLTHSQTVYCRGSFAGSNGYVRIKKGNKIYLNEHTGFRGSLNIRKPLDLDPGVYYVEFNSGDGSVDGYTYPNYKVTFSITYMKYGKLVRVVDHSTLAGYGGKHSFKLDKTTTAYYNWSGGVDFRGQEHSGGTRISASMTIKNNRGELIVSEGPDSASGSFTIEAGKTYTVRCDGGFMSYHGDRTFSADVDITYNDIYYKLTPLIENPDFGEVRIEGELFYPDDPDQDFEFESGDKVQLKAKARTEDGCEFIRWEENGKSIGTKPTQDVEMNKHLTIKAVFADVHVDDVTASSTLVIYNQRKIRLNWNDVDDLSGIKQYRIKFTNSNQPPKSDEDCDYLKEEPFLEVEDLSSKNTYYAWVKAEDNAGNISEDWLKIGPFSPPAEESMVLKDSAWAEVLEEKPTYQIQLTLQKVDAAKYIIQRRLAGSNNDPWEDIAVINYDEITPNELGEFTYIDQTNLSKHARYQYRVYTQNVLGVGDETGAVPYESIITVPNIASYEITAPQDRTVTNQTQHIFDLEPKIDIEGDEVRFRVICKNGENIISSSDVTTQNAEDFTFPSDGEWEWTMEIEEYSNGTLVSDSKNEVSGSILIDRKDPTGEFSSLKSEGGTELTMYTNSLDLKLALMADDLAGTLNSGIAGLYLWNGESQPKEYYELRDADLSEVVEETLRAAVADGEKGLYIKIGGSDTSVLQTTIEEIPWRLKPGDDGKRVISSAINDNAGNVSEIIQKEIILDTALPAMPTFKQCTFNGLNLVFNWSMDDSDQDLKIFLVKKADGTEIEIAKIRDETVERQYNGSFEVVMEPYKYNEPVTIEVFSLDQAGNISTAATKTAYTKAQLGAIVPGSLTPGFSQETAHGFSLTVTGGEAAGHLLELAEDDSFETIVEAAETRTDGKLFVSGLAPHGKYYYRLVALNGDGVRTEGFFCEYAVPNLSPPKPEGLKPDKYASTDIIFTFDQKNADDEGDALTYELYWNTGSGSSYERIPWNNEKQCYSVSLEKEGHGKEFSWYVTVHDEHGGTEISDLIYFTLDAHEPVLTLEKPDTVYTNQKELPLVVSDDLSGVQKIEYQLTDAETNTFLGELVNIPPEAGAIPLPEGYYHLDVTATDNAGNLNTQSLKNLRVDRISPELSEVVICLPNNGTTFYTNTPLIPITWTTTDDFAGIKGLYYWALSEQNQPLNDGGYISLAPSGGDYALSLDLGHTSGRYYLVVAVLDQAGNRSELKKIDQPILLDTTPPVVKLKLAGFHRHGTKNYLSPVNQSNLKIVEIAEEDKESGIEVKQFILKDLDSKEIIAESADLSGLTDAAFVSGSSYQIVYRVTNGVGLVTEESSPEFIYDRSAPEGLTLNLPETAFAVGELGRFSATAVEHETAIVNYRLGIGTAYDKLELSALIPGNMNGWLVQKTTSSAVEFRVEIPNIANGTYYVTLIVENAAGLQEKLKAGTIVINNSQDRVVVGDQGPYTMFSERITGFWRYAGDKEVQSYKYRLIDENGSVIKNCDWQTTTEESATFTQISLENGETYRFEVKVIFGDYTESASAYSPGVTVDTTIPEITELIVPQFTTSQNLAFHWEGMDAESGIKRIQAALGSDYYQTDVTKGWVEMAGAEGKLLYDATGEELEFDLTKNNRYYLTLRLVNGAGLAAEYASTCIVIDDTPPPTPVVIDQGSYINTKAEQPMEANWIWTPVDQESGNLEYKYAILKFGESITPQTVWYDGDETKRISLNMQDFVRVHGNTYYFAVKTTNGAGLTSIGFSDGIMADENAPFLTKVVLLEAANLGDAEAPEVNYITSNQDLGLWIDSYDPDSDIDTYLYTWGTQEEVEGQERLTSVEELIRLIDPEIEEGVVNVFLGETKNGAQLVSDTGYTTGVVLDTEAPKICDVHGAFSGNRLLFDWAVEESVSPVVRYEYALLTEDEYAAMTEDESYTISWEAAPDLSRSLALNADSIDDGKYYLIVRGYNAAGTYSQRSGEVNEWGISPMLMIDRTPPVIKAEEFQAPGFVHTKLEARVGAEDGLSGIHSYQYAVGGISNLFMYSDGWIDVMENDGAIALPVIKTGDIPHNSKIYLMVRVKDRVGLWSQAKLSPEIIVDHTRPVTPVITCGQYATDRSKVTEINFSSADPESGLTHYRMGVVSSQEQIKMEDWLFTEEGAVSGFMDFLDDLALEEENSYYLAMQTRNGAGVWSETGFSDSFLVDTIAPEITFSKAAETLVLNYPPLNIEYTLTEEAEVHFVLSGADGYIEFYTASGQAGLNNYVFEENKPQTYTLTAMSIDPAGNTGKGDKQSIRVNAPPQIALDKIYTTPGAPTVFKAVIYDPDADEGDAFEYTWDPGDNSELIAGEETVHRYGNEITDYTVTLTVADKDGGVATASTIAQVRNTSKGTLYMDEIWFGDHYLYGEVIVPEGITLIIRPGANVFSEKITGDNPAHVGLIVQGTLRVEGRTEVVTFSSLKGQAGDWAGIYVEGQAEIEGMTMRHAVRGLSVIEEAVVTVTNSIFQDNLLGLHCYDAALLIKDTSFIGHAWYGIKEDAEARPQVIDCVFGSNEIDYYSMEKSTLTMDELNEVTGNGGNQKNDN